MILPMQASPLDLLMRWIHLGAVIVAVGGVFFLRMIVHPVLMTLADEQRVALRGQLIGRWKVIVHACIGLILISGLYNYLAVMRPRHAGQGGYHMLVGIKIMLALGVFFIAEALVGRARAFEGMRRASPTWLLLYLLLAAGIIGISGYLKYFPTTGG